MVEQASVAGLREGRAEAILVVGMHRSGTSALTGVLRLAGVDLGERLIPGQADNPKGFFEHDDIWRIHDRLLAEIGSGWRDVRTLPTGWLSSAAAQRCQRELAAIVQRDFSASPLWAIKDPRLSRVFELWPQVLRTLSVEPKVILALRHPQEVARSLMRRDGLGAAHALALWLRYSLDAEYATRGHLRVVQYYPDLLSDWRGALNRLGDALKVDELVFVDSPGADEIEAFLDTSMRHWRTPGTWDGWPQPIAGFCERALSALLALPESAACDELDAIRLEWRNIENMSLPFIEQFTYSGHEADSARTRAGGIDLTPAAPEETQCVERVLQVAVLSFDNQVFACPQIRLLAPFRHLRHRFQLNWVMQLETDSSWTPNTDLLAKADVVIAQRFFPIAETRPLLEEVKARGTPLIYELDDLLTALPPSNPHYVFAQHNREFVLDFIRMADALVVSTDELKQAYAPLNPRIHVLPNYLDDELWIKPCDAKIENVRRTDSPVRILFGSTPTHTEDLSFVMPALERLKTEYGNALEFVFLGLAPSEDHRLGDIHVLEFQPDYQAYADCLRNSGADLAVVPLIDNAFNRAKSAIKWLEYASLGIPGVYSDLPPYRDVEHGRTGLLVANTVDAWHQAIDELIRSPELRRSLGEAARREVENNWTLAARRGQVEHVYRTICETALPTVSHARASRVEALRLEASLQDAIWIREEAAKGAAVSVGILIRGRQQDEDRLDVSRRSLKDQWMPPSQVLTVADAGLETANKAVASLSTDWIVILRAGDICAPALVAMLARAVAGNPDWAAVYFDEAQRGEQGQVDSPHYKPDFNLDYLRSLPYVGTALAVRRDRFEALGGFGEDYEGIEEYEYLLRISSCDDGTKTIGHLSGALVFHEPGAVLSDRALMDVQESGRGALISHLRESGLDAGVEHGPLPLTYRVRYQHGAQPLVSIIIPTRNQRAMLERCLESLFAHTAWPNYEILVVDNGSDEADALQYLDGLRTLGADLGGRLRVLHYPHAFNYSAMNNLAAGEAHGEYLLLLNNDTAALHDEWLDAMMAHAQRAEVGVVGAKLLYPDGKVQHAGVVLGMKGPAEHPFIGQDAKSPGYYARLQVDQNYSAVTGACLLVRKSLFDQVGGLDADELAVSYSDIDLCLKVRELGKLVVWTPHALLLHEGSKSQTGGVEAAADQAKQQRFAREQAIMFDRWMPQIANDPAYNRCLSLSSTDFVAELDPALCWDPEWRPVPRIIAQSGDRMGCGEYRIIAPTRALVNAGRIQGQETQRIYTPPELARLKPDALVLQRQIETHQIAAIERHKRFNDVFCVFEIDDLITNLPVKSAHRKHMPKDMFKRLRRSVGLCDRLVVATDVLAEAYASLSADVRVVPNFVEEARWGALAPRRRGGGRPRVGWAGGVSHAGDLELIAGVIEELKDEVEWVFFGMCPERVRPFVHEFHPPVPLDQYAQTLASLNLDLALAPLEDVPFNHAKSHLRLLEYGILGYPVVCSDLTPYQGDFPVTRVRNRHRDWVEAIREHVTDLDASAERGDALREHVRKHWLLERNLDVWLEGWLP